MQVTPKDMQDAFEAQYGEKLRCRMILVDKQHKAMAIWEELRKNPGGFETIAKEQSMDTGSRSLGGLLAEPITRHAYPADPLRRGVPPTRRRRPARPGPQPQAQGRRLHRPDPGRASRSGSSSAASRSIPAAKGVSLKDEQVRKQTYEMIYEVKLKEAMGIVFQELIKAAAIENQLTGTVKLANEEKDPDYGVDGDVKLMSNPPAGKARLRRPHRPVGVLPREPRCRRRAGLSPEAAKEFEKIKRPLKPGGNAEHDAAQRQHGDAAAPN